jgi:DNA topoisomerase-1
MDLVFADLTAPGITRQRCGKGFSYRDETGSRLTDAATLQRVRDLVIPPAWRDVWICPNPAGHVQAIGRDEKGRRQYIYHAAFRAEREAEKFEKMITFAQILPRLRRRVSADMALPGLDRDKVLATVVYLLDRTLIRIGNETYARDNGSFGLSTLRSGHVAVAGATVRFTFKGKSGKEWRLAIFDKRVSRIVRTCQDLPGQHLFQYRDKDGELRAVSSDEVNDYLRRAAGSPVSAKDFRTWAGTVLCGLALSLAPPPPNERQLRKQLASAVRAVSQRLGNTPAVCRSSYIHPAIFSAHTGGLLTRYARRMSHATEYDAKLTPAERAVLKILNETLEQKPAEPAAREMTAEAA